MGRLAIALCAATVLALRAVGAVGDGDPAPLPAVGAGLAELRAAFAAADGKARLVVVTSEESPVARSAIRAEILAAVPSPDLAVIAIWVPEKAGDDPGKAAAKAAREAARVAEPRLAAFWAADPAALDPWRASLAPLAAPGSISSGEMPRSGLCALYPPDARWGESIPAPAFWTHANKRLAKSHPAIDLAALRRAIEERLVRDPEDVADIPTEVRRAGGDANQLYFLHGPVGSGDPPAKGSPLLVVLPGGDGSAEFRAFVKRMAKQSAGNGWLIAQLVSKKWTESQTTIWPTERSKAGGQEFTTEVFIDAVLVEVCELRRVDRERIVIFAWSSGGPAIYAHALRAPTGKDTIPVRRYLVSQSVYRPAWHPPVEGAKGKRFFLHHSREDDRCKFEDAERARLELGRAGATVELLEYAGGHGWHGDMYDQIRRGLRWLLEE